jgi:hypothetical protein
VKRHSFFTGTLSALGFAAAALSPRDGLAEAVHGAWGASNALTIAPQTSEGALLGRFRLGVTRRLELSGRPLFSALVPGLEAKVQVWNNGSWFLATRTELLSPTPLLRVIAKEGAFGLLPASTQAGFGVILENALLLSHRLGSNQWGTLQGGGTMAIGRQDKLPLLEFPFLYARYTPIVSGGSLFLSVATNGELFGPSFGYEFATQLWLLPIAPARRFATETKMAVTWNISESRRLELGTHISINEFQIGWRSYWLPSIDYSWKW